MDKKIATFPVLIANLATKVDGSIKIVLETRELDSESSAKLFDMRQKEAWVFISPSQSLNISLPEEKPDPAIGTKTPSRRLRAVIYKVWELSKSRQDFDSYYFSTMEKVIEQFKERLEPMPRDN